MFDFSAIDFTKYQWLILCVCAVLVGVTKTGVPGVGILCVPLLAIIFQAKASTGLLLPLLAFADIFAVAYYRRHAQWGHIVRLLPPAIAGIITGSLIISYIDNDQLKPIIGIIVLAMLALNYLRTRKNADELHVPSHWSFAVTMGFVAGLATQLANAAGPIMIIYFLAMKFDKHKFIGTSAWYFLIVNWIKMPSFMWDGRITADSLKADIMVLPFVIVGVVIGILVFKKIPQKLFNSIVQWLAVLSAIKLTLSIFGI